MWVLLVSPWGCHDVYNNVLALKSLLGGHPVLGWQHLVHLVQSKLGTSDCTRIHASGAQVEDLGLWSVEEILSQVTLLGL